MDITYKLIHYSDDPNLNFDVNFNYPVRKFRSLSVKPYGLWVSIESDSFGESNYNWKQWCEAEDFRLDRLKYSYLVSLRDDAKIIILKTSKEIFDFTKKYPLESPGWDSELDTYNLDWIKMKEDYQGIIIAPYQWECQLDMESGWYYGWDCSSGCIWDLNCIENFVKICDGCF